MFLLFPFFVYILAVNVISVYVSRSGAFIKIVHLRGHFPGKVFFQTKTKKEFDKEKKKKKKNVFFSKEQIFPVLEQSVLSLNVSLWILKCYLGIIIVIHPDRNSIILILKIITIPD